MKINTPKEAQDPKFDCEIGEAFMALTPQRRPMKTRQVLLPQEISAHRRHRREAGTCRSRTDQHHISDQPSQKER